MKKHAYLIMAHNEFHTLENLLKALDDERNDIYIHIDKKAGNVDTDMLRGAVHRSGIFFIKRRKIYWGTLSIVKCELDLLSSATKEEYHYYHLISGVDFPLKSQDYIHDFLEN
ncbi:MAG: glycosyl transferase, partial [Butyrivibrio sp.]|nr:glycosyl transferase [Butyrivibrio sp.]